MSRGIMSLAMPTSSHPVLNVCAFYSVMARHARPPVELPPEAQKDLQRLMRQVCVLPLIPCLPSPSTYYDTELGFCLLNAAARACAGAAVICGQLSSASRVLRCFEAAGKSSASCGCTSRFCSSRSCNSCSCTRCICYHDCCSHYLSSCTPALPDRCKRCSRQPGQEGVPRHRERRRCRISGAPHQCLTHRCDTVSAD